MRILNISSVLLAAAGSMIGASSATTTPAYSNELLEALDPTRLGRLTCRGLDTSSATLEARLKQAGLLSNRQNLGAGEMALYPGLSPTDIPAPELQGMAARYFAQGLSLAYGFNHKAAIRSFRMAQQADPGCALCYWGEAMANGPNINAGMSSDENQAALAALAKAEALVETASPAGQALIRAQVLRYSQANEDRAALDQAYAAAMQDVARDYPESDDIAVLAAESAMNTTAWDYWEDVDTPRPAAGQAIALIETVVRRTPEHPQASHLYIHLMEATQPDKAEAAADRLFDGAAPAALGHLVHMPSHIYYRIGRYKDSMEANVAAVRADEAYLAEIGDDGMYRYAYYPHNVHFLLTSAMMVGDMRRTITEAHRLSTILDVEISRQLHWVQAIHAAPAFALAQYEKPAAILALTREESPLDYVDAMRHYARAIAYAQLGDDAAFSAEIAVIEELSRSPDVAAMEEAGLPAPAVVHMAALVAQGRKAHWAGNYADAVALFNQAEEIEATIPYNEPPFWYYPIAQSRGAALYSAGRYDDAREAFRKALFMAPNNGWALYGLAQTEARLGHGPEAAAARAALDKVWMGERAWLKMDRL